MAIQEKLYSVEDLWELSHAPENADKRFELIEGALIEMTPSNAEHGGLALEFGALIRSHVKANRLGYCTGAEAGYIVHIDPETGRDTVLAPDVGFVRAERLPEGLPPKYAPMAPDLAVEVVSPTDTASDVHDKVQTYLRYGTRMVVLLYPRSRTAVVHTPEGSRTIDADGVFDGGGVLPGLSIPLAEIFAAVGPIKKD